MSYYDTDSADHECPTPLERPAGEWNIGGQFFSPAGRWETVTDLRSPRSHLFVDVTTDRCAWQFWASDKLPFIPDYRIQQQYVRLDESTHTFVVSVGAERGVRHGHVLVTAQQVKGAGWTVHDRPAGNGNVEQVTVASKAHARTEMKRRAKAHAKRLGVPMASERSR